MTPLTHEEVYNSYEYSIAKRLLKQKFPYIIDMKLDTDDINRYGLVFLDIEIDLKKFMDLHPQVRLTPWMKYKLQTNSSGLYPFINLIFDGGGIKDVSDDMDSVLTKLHFSPALPDELRLPKDRRLSPSAFTVTPSLQDPELISSIVNPTDTAK